MVKNEIVAAGIGCRLITRGNPLGEADDLGPPILPPSPPLPNPAKPGSSTSGCHANGAAPTPRTRGCKRFRARGGHRRAAIECAASVLRCHPAYDVAGCRPRLRHRRPRKRCTREMVAGWQNRPLLHIGPERDHGLFEGYDVQFAKPDTAEVIVCSGLYDDSKETPADSASLFEPLLARQVPMICANPDILVERGADLIYCAGALAADYEAKGGKVIYAGKPHNPIYDRTQREIARVKGAPVAKEYSCIGDGVETTSRAPKMRGCARCSSPVRFSA